VCTPKAGEIKAGCEVHPVAYWRKNMQKLFKQHGLTSAQHIEYKAAIEFACKRSLWFKRQQKKWIENLNKGDGYESIVAGLMT
jgi:hypothetical protein